MEPRKVDQAHAEFWRFSLVAKMHESEPELAARYLQGASLEERVDVHEIARLAAKEYFAQPSRVESSLMRNVEISPEQMIDYHSIVEPRLRVAQGRIEPVRLMTLAAQYGGDLAGSYSDALRALYSPMSFIERELADVRTIETTNAAVYNFWEQQLQGSSKRVSIAEVNTRLELMRPFVFQTAVAEIELIWGQKAAGDVRMRYDR